MKKELIIGLVGACGLAATLVYGASVPQNAERTVNEGVYTSAQADRGAQVVEDYGCRSCHGATLEGGAEEQPPLWGEEFIGSWSGRKVSELAEKITTMPANAEPGYQVKPAAAPDVVAFLLRANGYPVGKTELPADTNTLSRIKIVAP
jgi:mono/diheme cytochrome c family protein